MTVAYWFFGIAAVLAVSFLSVLLLRYMLGTRHPHFPMLRFVAEHGDPMHEEVRVAFQQTLGPLGVDEELQTLRDAGYVKAYPVHGGLRLRYEITEDGEALLRRQGLFPPSDDGPDDGPDDDREARHG